MLLLCHLFAGLALGFLLAYLFKNKYAVLICGLGGILPDLIDKPLGHVFFSETIGDGRIYFHTLLFALVILLIGAIILKKKKNILVLCLGIGVTLHQILDSMWLTPQIWFWPAFGRFITHEEFEGIILGEYLGVLIVCLIEIVVFGFLYGIIFRKKSLFSQLIFIAVCFVIEMMTVFIVKIFNGTFALGGGGGGSYIVEMFFKEITSSSEMIFGISSLIILILVFLSISKKFDDLKSAKIARILYAVCIFAGFVLTVLFAFGLPADGSYNLSGHIYAVAVLIVFGALALILSKKVIESAVPKADDWYISQR